MKTRLTFRLSLVFILLLLGSQAQSQSQSRAADQPVRGYWNLETNLTTRDYTIVRFYNDQHELLYEQRLSDLCLDLSRGTGLCHRTAQQLNGALRQVLRDPATAAQTMGTLAQQLGQSRRVQRMYAVR